MNLLGDDLLRAERRRFMGTIESLTDADFESGRTLCSAWAPRDVLAHLIGTDTPSTYLRHAGRVNRTNKLMVDEAKVITRAALTDKGRRWAEQPSGSSRALARFLIGDVSVHHQDVVRGLGQRTDVPPEIAAAILREGVILSTGTKRNLLRYRVEPTTPGGRPLGRGIRVRGSSDALGLWLAGRKGLDDELEFSG
jgi:uncharacterized protein (TIGR03083 family)